MQFSSFLLVATFAISIARCAPLNSTILSDNAKQAQELNAKSLNLKATDPCQGDETACVGGNKMKCAAGKFEIAEQCLDGQECFAIPLIQTPGTSLLCTTERNALGLIKAANLEGGITGSDNNSSSSISSRTSSTSTSLSTSSTASPSDTPEPARNPGNINNPAVVTVTVTQFANPVNTTTTATLSPTSSSSVPKNVLSGELPSASPPSSVPPLTSAAEPSGTPPPSPSVSSTSPVILLSAAGGANPTPSPSSTPSSTSTSSPIQLSAVAEVPNPSAPTPAPSPSGPVNIPVGGGGGSYQ